MARSEPHCVDISYDRAPPVKDETLVKVKLISATMHRMMAIVYVVVCQPLSVQVDQVGRSISSSRYGLPTFKLVGPAGLVGNDAKIKRKGTTLLTTIQSPPTSPNSANTLAVPNPRPFAATSRSAC